MKAVVFHDVADMPPEAISDGQAILLFGSFPATRFGTDLAEARKGNIVHVAA